MDEQVQEILDEYPFLTLATYGGKEYLGIVQNQDATMISMYVLSEIKSPEIRRLFLTYGNEWWEETNRQIPINIILGEKFAVFRSCLRTFNLREFKVLSGPVVCLRSIIKTKPRRKNIRLVQSMD